MFDVIVRNGLVVTPYASSYADIAIKGETIAAIAPHGTLVAEAAHVMDASGKIVVPGGIDPHIHSKWPIPSPDGGAPEYTAGIEQVSRAAVHGGTTTLIDFAVWERNEHLEQTLERREKDFSGQSYCDYAYHVMLTGAIPPEIIDEIPGVVASGHPSVKLFTTDITPSRRGRKVNTGHIWEVLQRLAKAGGIAAIHAEDDDLVMHMYDKLDREDRTHFTNMAEAHSALSEELSFRRVIRLAEHVEGAALYFMHVSAKSGVESIAESQAKGFPIYGETLHQYAMFSADDAYFRPNGQIYHTYPSLKANRDRRALWQGMADGTIGTIATDELCTLLELKTRGISIHDVTGGNSGVEPRMGIMYTEAVTARGFSLRQFVDVTSANAARYFGMYPRKGALLEGSDADICVIDPGRRFVLQKEHLHETDYSPWEGWAVTGWPVATIVRGKVMMENGTLTGQPNWGRWVRRKISEGVLFGPRQ